MIRLQKFRALRTAGVTLILLSVSLPFFSLRPVLVSAKPEQQPRQDEIDGPFFGPTVKAEVFTGSLLDLQPDDTPRPPRAPAPLKYTPNTKPKSSSAGIAGWIDALAQTDFGGVRMPDPIDTFGGISYSGGGAGDMGNGHPPDTVGDVGPNHYIQAVNTGIVIFDKQGTILWGPAHFDTFFQAPATPCEDQNSGDPVVVYDRFADRWLISDFAVPGESLGYWQCIAVSQSSDPVNGGWYFYAIKISDTDINDYPKIGVWRNSYAVTFNMFRYVSGGWDWNGVQVWALDRSAMLAGDPLRTLYFSLPAASDYESLLPAHALDLPAADEPAYIASVQTSNKLYLWKLNATWGEIPSGSLTGPTTITVADFAAAASIPQPNVSQLLDSLSPRPMMQLIYRRINQIPAVWMTHTVSNAGIAAQRWYEVRALESTPVLYQQGTYQPDSRHRWMGSLAVDKDGNMALGYSASATNLFPGIRYTGRLQGEPLGMLPQGETILAAGAGSQMSTLRWGDYSAMSVDPVDDCTFYYTNEYYAATGTNWQTQVGYFKYPSCGQAKGIITGVVRNSATNEPIPGVIVVADSGAQQMTVFSDQNGIYTISLAADTFALTAGPLAPAYPDAATVQDVPLVAGETTHQDLLLGPMANLSTAAYRLVDASPGGNGNAIIESGESDIQLFLKLENTGAAASTNIQAELASLTTGVSITQASSSYPNIAPNVQLENSSAYVLSVAPAFHCGNDIRLRQTVTDQQKTYTLDAAIPTGITPARWPHYSYNFDSGPAGWTHSGTNDRWAITTSSYHSSPAAWADSPDGNYDHGAISYLRSPALSFRNLDNLTISFWTYYELEAGYDYVYLDYSTDGGATWSSNTQALATLNGVQETWKQISVDAGVLASSANAVLRFRLESDGSIAKDGVYIDDVLITYQPHICLYGKNLRIFPIIFR